MLKVVKLGLNSMTFIILYFDSWSHALSIAETTDFAKVSDSMRRHNMREFHRIQEIWLSEFAELDKARRVSMDEASSNHDTNLAHNGFESLAYVESHLNGVPHDFAE
jgi:hypothetical protein